MCCSRAEAPMRTTPPARPACWGGASELGAQSRQACRGRFFLINGPRLIYLAVVGFVGTTRLTYGA